MKRGLVWFKNDLRLHDNEALTRANEFPGLTKLTIQSQLKSIKNG